MTGAGVVGIADVRRALALLRPADEGTTSAVAELLGFDLLSSGDRVPPWTTDDSDLQTEEAMDVGRSAAADDAEIERLVPVGWESYDAAARTDWRAAEPVDELPLEVLTAPLSLEPLLPRRSTPSIIAAAASTAVENDEPDAEQLVEVVATGRPVDRIPHGVRPTLIRGVQVLVDHGKGMEPFARDQVELVRDIVSVVGRSAVQRASFRNAPTRGILPAGRWRRQAYAAPPPGTPVLALTDLGIGGPPVYPTRARADEWIALADLLAQRGSPLLAFVPYPPSRWPPRIAAAIEVLTWDRSTSLSTVLMARRRRGRPR
jgi:hypothetical protein